MGSCISAVTAPSGKILDEVDGKELQYHEDFLEDTIIGQGEFGVVKLVHPMNDAKESMAVKILNKGLTFKDNTLYAPLPASSIRSECMILRKLNGEHHNLKMYKVYETRAMIFIVTELCQGGDMMQWVSKMEDDLTVEEVSRVSFEILDAVSHCAKHGIIHRDIKPENIMFKTNKSSSSLRLIDFGSSSIDDADFSVEANLEHFTFAGSAFYSAPEMFQQKYTSKIDVWSVGVSLYVLVAGFPADSMQKAFNKIQNPKRDLKELPNMPNNLPDSYFDMLDKLMTYRRKDRTAAVDMLTSEFATLHQKTPEKELSISSVLQDAESFNNLEESGSVSGSLGGFGKKIVGSVRRHNLYLDYSKFERSIVTLLAAVLSNEEYNALLAKLTMKVSDRTFVSEKRLGVVKISVLKQEMGDMGLMKAVGMMKKLPNASAYDGHSFRLSLLRLFIYNGMDNSQNGKKYRQVQNEMLGHSTHGLQTQSSKIGVMPKRARSVHGNNVWESFKKSGKKLNFRDNLSSSKHTFRDPLSTSKHY